MAIRAEADDRHFLSRPREQALALRLDEGFGVTFGRVHGELSFWLADPKLQVRERFGLQQEVLVIYSEHCQTDARILTAIEYITRSPEFKFRIDKVLFFLIHNGTPEQADAIVSNDTDRVIIPILESELLNPNRGNVFLRSKVASLFGQLDLFGVSSPLTSDRYFFGRDELVQSLANRTIVRKENSGLYGLRKMGKTSVLKAVQRRLGGKPILVAYIECSTPGVHNNRWWQMLELIKNRFDELMRSEHKRTLKFGSEYRQGNGARIFRDDVLRILNDGQIDQIVLMLDEIEYITSGLAGSLGKHWDQDYLPFWQTIRSVFQELEGKLNFIVAGVNPSCSESPQFESVPNPIFQLAIPHYLAPFAASSVREMIRSIGKYSGVRFEEDVYPYLAQRYGGHPYLIRLACSEVWLAAHTTDPSRLTEVKRADFERLNLAITARLANPIKDILLPLIWWYGEEYELLQILAAGDTDFVEQYLKEKPDVVVRFGRYGMLTEGATPKFAINDIRDFLQNHGNDYKKVISPFTRGDLPAELLPEVPDLKLLSQLFEKKCELEIKLRRAIIMYLGVRCNWDNTKITQAMLKGVKPLADRKNPSQLFIDRTPQDVANELYTLDLKCIVTENWEVFGPLFDNEKRRFEMNMDTVNEARCIDSHTKPVTQDDADNFMNSYLWVNRRLTKAIPTT